MYMNNYQKATWKCENSLIHLDGNIELNFFLLEMIHIPEK